MSRGYTDEQRLSKQRGAIRREINPSGAYGPILKCLSCGQLRHLLDDRPDKWENMKRKKTIEAELVKTLHQSDKEKEACEGFKVFKGEITRSGVFEEFTSVVPRLKEKMASLNDDIKEINIDKDRELGRQKEESEYAAKAGTNERGDLNSWKDWA